ncbi:DUF1015 domain-containing protein [Streptomonospora nanhaiensis]|uniref:Uncharacterized protein (DUF1015 family) n=1 Tax=Streptomonospora nanhaiensis TaxID=1323731 RepID=A0A853BVQ7_9ACTN|nr:DUF1015 domain-containing protein [Streptomonospora nanhaiensis]MBX9390675.1 DUF1015 domain-containing protein [Streptomonospora nanhaiensis]NYI98866.1 uncharacterized protein (DUF1015 family) [Streptomonospora nanhaiensis]
MRTDAGAEALELAPLRGLRYASPDARTLLDSPDFNIALALAPPYDLLDAAAFADLTRAEPHNAVRLTVPPAAVGQEPGGAEPPITAADRYAAAARTLRRWIAQGVLVRDPRPALYVYEQTPPGGQRQRGLIGALRLPAPGSAVVRPHEDVAPGPVEDRARLMAATQANLEPIFLLYRGGTGAARGAAAQVTDTVAASRPHPLVDTVTEDGVAHRLWAVTDPALHRQVAEDLAQRSAMIADGHHRYAAYQRLKAGRHGPGPWDHGLALLVDSDSSPPRLGAIHRVLRGMDVDAAVAALAGAAEVVPLRTDGAPGRPRGDAAYGAARAGGTAGEAPALVLADPADHRRRFLVRVPPDRLAEAFPDRSSAWRALPTALFHHLLPRWGGEDRVDLVHDDPEAAVAAARPGRDTAALLGPAPIEQVYAIAAHGELTPRKSTSFGPKPRTGLVLRGVEGPSAAEPGPRRRAR